MRSREQIIRDFTQSWFRKAESDLQAAEILAGADLKDFFAAAFHAQQAVEKYLKALLVRYQIEFRKTHHIEELLQLASEANKTLPEELSFATWLTQYGVEFRYPGEREVDSGTAKRAVQDAKKVKKAILPRLSDYLKGQLRQ